MYFPEHSTAGLQVLKTTRDDFALYGDRYGPVPYTWLAAVEADIPDGMEFTGLFLLGKPYYAEFDGSPQNYLTVIAAHETAHQWWYSLVGNDPAGEPWLDEALATYSEEIYFEAAYPELVEWWWQFRVWWYLPEGSLETDIYASDEFRPYVNAVYLNGAQFMHALRGEAGDETFFQFLRAYAERGAGRIVTGDDFWQVYAEFGDAEGSAARAAYFGAP
jgi:aminopeptidase N